MHLKKRGFNVDRILNQQREERLRVKAEAARDQEKQRAAESQLTDDSQSIRSDTTTSTVLDKSPESNTNSAYAAGKTKGLLDKLRRSSKDLKSPSMPSMPGMPGGFTNNMMKGMSGSRSSSSGMGQDGSSAGRAPSTTTKRVSQHRALSRASALS